MQHESQLREGSPCIIRAEPIKDLSSRRWGQRAPHKPPWHLRATPHSPATQSWTQDQRQKIRDDEGRQREGESDWGSKSSFHRSAKKKKNNAFSAWFTFIFRIFPTVANHSPLFVVQKIEKGKTYLCGAVRLMDLPAYLFIRFYVKENVRHFFMLINIKYRIKS